VALSTFCAFMMEVVRPVDVIQAKVKYADKEAFVSIQPQQMEALPSFAEGIYLVRGVHSTYFNTSTFWWQPTANQIPDLTRKR